MDNKQQVSLPPDAPLEDVRELFANDRYATELSGCVVEAAGHGTARCSMILTERHMNARGKPMGGAIFTLADFALAVACNVGEPPTVAISNTIDFLSVAKGDKLIASAEAVRQGKRVAFFHVDVRDNTGAIVAQMSAKCFRAPS